MESYVYVLVQNDLKKKKKKPSLVSQSVDLIYLSRDKYLLNSQFF